VISLCMTDDAGCTRDQVRIGSEKEYGGGWSAALVFIMLMFVQKYACFSIDLVLLVMFA
jgi:hypothetical protein